MPFTTSRRGTVRGCPLGETGGNRGSSKPHWASVKSVGYALRSIPQSYRLPANHTKLFQCKFRQLSHTLLESIPFVGITPDAKSNWLSQSNNKFAQLIALANRQAKLGQSRDLGVTVFELVTPAVKSNRDGWVYDFDAGNLRDKAIFFTATYNKFLEEQDGSFDPVIKWSDSLRDSFQRGETTVYDDGNRVESLWRPYVKKWYLAEPMLNDRLTRNHYELFGSNLHQPNQIINFCTNGKDFYALAADRPAISCTFKLQ